MQRERVECRNTVVETMRRTTNEKDKVEDSIELNCIRFLDDEFVELFVDRLQTEHGIVIGEFE